MPGNPWTYLPHPRRTHLLARTSTPLSTIAANTASAETVPGTWCSRNAPSLLWLCRALLSDSVLAHALGILKKNVLVLGDIGDVGGLDGSGLWDLNINCDRDRDMKVALEWDGPGCKYGDLPFTGRGLRRELASSTSSSSSSSLASLMLWMSLHSRGRSEPQCEHRRV